MTGRNAGLSAAEAHALAGEIAGDDAEKLARAAVVAADGGKRSLAVIYQALSRAA